MSEVVGALNEQIQTDFVPYWHVKATVGSYAKAPAGTWQIIVQTKLDDPQALGYHTNDVHNQPISYVEMTDDWSVSVSHELLEMLADPFGYRMHAARLPQGVELEFAHFGLKTNSSRVHYLLEVCDPCENTAYEVGGVNVSDFLLPTWYRTWQIAGVAYSRVSGCEYPREVADGGYVSFANDAGEWYQVSNDQGELTVEDLGKFDRKRFASLREFADSKMRAQRARA